MGGDTTLIIIIAVVVVLCCCVGGFMYKKHSEKSGEGEGTTVNEFNTDLYTAFIDQETA
jgi:flagellar basal body-associated protein FliL